MRNHRNKLTIGLALVAMLVFGSARFSNADVSAPARVPLVGPDALLDCADLQPAAGENSSEAGPGDVAFRQNRDGTIQATVRLRRAAPDTTYFVRLIQVGDGTCPGEGAFVTTNGNGNAITTIIQAVLEGSAAAQVFVSIPETGEPPFYRASDRYLVAS